MAVKTQTAYALMWMEGGDMIHTLVYRSKEPEVRTYYRGHLDMRAADEKTLQRFEPQDDTGKVLLWMMKHPDEKCLVPVATAKELYDEPYAEPV